MLVLSEWLPNPVGSDAAAEWVELKNIGVAPVSTGGYALVASGKTKVVLRAHLIPPGGYLTLPRSETRLALHNTDGALALFNPTGHQVSAAAFVGTAPDGQSVNVGPDGAGLFGTPTPGAANQLSAALLIERSFPAGQPLASGLAWFDIVGLGLLVAVALAAVFAILIKQRDDLAELFFGGY